MTPCECKTCEGIKRKCLENSKQLKQPDPEPGEKEVLPYVLRDLIQRQKDGKKKYGTYLETKNGRDALQDAYEEALDLCMYLKQAILEKAEHEELKQQVIKKQREFCTHEKTDYGTDGNYSHGRRGDGRTI